VHELRLRDDELNWRELDGEIVALDGAGSTYVATNKTGATLWRLLAEGTTRDRLVEQLVDSFGVARERAEADVDAFVAELQAKGLLAP
jgi:hypothetical protein